MSHLSSVDKSKHQSSNFSRKDQHDDHKELRKGGESEKNQRKSTTTWRSSGLKVNSHLLPHTQWHTYKTQPEFGLPDGGAAPHQAENEHHRADADDDRRGDQSVPVLDEAVKVVIAPDHIGPDIGQSRPCSLGRGEAPWLRADKWTEHLLHSSLQTAEQFPPASNGI